MPESYVQVPPNSTGAKVHTRDRVIGANTVTEQYVIAAASDAVPVNRVWLSTLRIPVRVLAAGVTQPLFSIWNGITAGGNSVSVRRFSVEIDQVGAYATGASPILRLFRATAAATGGTVITPVQQYSPDVAFNSLVSVRADHQADNAVATTALAQTGLGAQPMWSQTVPRMVTAAGFQTVSEFNMVPNDSTLNAVDPLILRPQEGCHVQFVNGGTATSATVLYSFMFKVVLAEFTYP